jgi:hypothetical protein
MQSGKWRNIPPPSSGSTQALDNKLNRPSLDEIKILKMNELASNKLNNSMQ